eukprot:5917427-Pleurochrysis_carterae.AAC.3
MLLTAKAKPRFRVPKRVCPCAIEKSAARRRHANVAGIRQESGENACAAARAGRFRVVRATAARRCWSRNAEGQQRECTRVSVVAAAEEWERCSARRFERESWTCEAFPKPWR